MMAAMHARTTSDRCAVPRMPVSAQLTAHAPMFAANVPTGSHCRAWPGSARAAAASEIVEENVNLVPMHWPTLSERFAQLDHSDTLHSARLAHGNAIGMFVLACTEKACVECRECEHA